MNADVWAFRAFLALYAVALLMIVGQLVRSPGPVQTVDLPAITVERTDPFPCLSDPAVRAACAKLGCECRGER